MTATRRAGGTRRPRTRDVDGATPAARARAARQARYDAVVDEMKRTHGLRVRRWRSATSGVAWEVTWSDGRTSRLIESPYPRGPVSCAVFLHEVGHHAIGFRTYRLRCQEEYHAWRWGLHAMVERDLAVTPSVHKRVTIALAWAVAKARRRGLRRLPAELAPFDDPALLELARPRSGPSPRLPLDLVPEPGSTAGEAPPGASVVVTVREPAAVRPAAGPGDAASPVVAAGAGLDGGEATGTVGPDPAAGSVEADPDAARAAPDEASEGWWRLGPLFALVRRRAAAR